MDIEKQNDELTALESIYNDEEFSFYKEKEQYEITLKIFISLSKNYYFTYKDSRQIDQKHETISVSHLPPLSLQITLPLNYPSTEPPKFILRSTWLKRTLISRLCKQLDQLWENNKGQEILFTWIDFLQTKTLEFLNIQECINMDHFYTLFKQSIENTQNMQKIVEYTNAKETDEECNSKVKNILLPNQSEKYNNIITTKQSNKSINKKMYDSRAVSDILIGKNPIQMLIDYNEMRKQIEFRKKFYSCKICFNDKIGEHCTQFLPCSHIFCKQCIIGYFEIKIKEGTVQNILCPEDKCKSEATPGQVKDLLSPELFSKYDSILLRSTLDTMIDIIYCPRKSCQYPVSREANEIMANCPVCQYAFCIFCKAVYHGIEPCKANTAEKQDLVKDYQEGTDERKAELELRYGKKQLQALVENTMSESWILTNSQNCPKCNAAIEKSDGCNKMVCWKCNVYFCWICQKELNREDPYRHYRDQSSKCFNMLLHGLVVHDAEDDDDENVDYDDENVDYDDGFIIDDDFIANDIIFYGFH